MCVRNKYLSWLCKLFVYCVAFVLCRASASVDQTMATWGGSTVDNMESITEDGAAQDNDDDEDEDDGNAVLYTTFNLMTLALRFGNFMPNLRQI